MEASELFGICEQLAQSEPSAAATRQLHEVLVLTCAEGCRQQGGTFGNLFAQADFLGKRLGMTVSETIALQTVRRHSNTGAPISTEDWPYDVRTVTRLVSAVFKADVPGTLLQRLPADQRPQPKGLHIDKKYIRCIANSVDAQFIHADTDEGEITIDYQQTDRDFGYLQKVVRQGMQMNLLDCTITNDCIIPGQVIVEPDFLVDISAIAACFTNYGHHPLLYTLNRLKERANTQAILLGNYAGTALDDVINQGTGATTALSLQRSFREQALQFCACPDFNPEKFKVQAEEQMQHIREAVVILQKAQQATTFLLEPSFVCEKLGLQGRVDLMSSNLHLLVEQKAGRNHKIERQSHDSHGLQLESHYVQLLLYYGVLRYNFGLSDRQADIRLLYSRYPAAQGLLTVNYYRTLLREALRLRNQIVATELLIAREGFQRILPLLREDVIYQGVTRDEHFHHYVLPDLQLLAQHYLQVTPLERTYYERMLTFVYREQTAQKLGSSEGRLHHSGGCSADLWQMSLSEKTEAGNIIMGHIAPSQQTPWETVTLSIVPVTADEDTGIRPAPNFRPGDPVFLYACRGGQPDACSNILFKGTLQELTASSLTIALNEAQQTPDLFRTDDDCLWAVEHSGSDISTNSSIRSLHRFITATPRCRDLLLSQRAPEADTSLQLSRPYHPSYDEVLLKTKQARDYFLLVGPPGTGKTSMALRYIVEEETGSHANNVLLMAYTNRAVDEICAMLCTLNGQDADDRPHFLRLGKAASCDRRFHPYLLDAVLAGSGHLDDARRIIDETPIIVATTSMLQSQPWILELKHFSLAVVDEASQILEPGIIGLLSSDAIDRFVLIGDHKQLPAVVQQEPQQSVVTEQCLRDIGLTDCRHSLFERLLRWEHQQGRTQFTGTLHTHGRMHPEVATFALTHFYRREQLNAVPLPHQQEQSLGYDLPARDHLDELLKSRRLLFVETTETEQQNPEEAEARLVADLVRRIHRFTARHFDPAKTVGIIVPYRRQIALIRQAQENINNPDEEHKEPVSNPMPITIDTVERYQGSQRDVIIFSFGVSRRYQLDFLTATTFTDDDGTLIDRKLNVALTRARRQLIVTGHRDVLNHVPLFRQLMEEAKA